MGAKLAMWGNRKSPAPVFVVISSSPLVVSKPPSRNVNCIDIIENAQFEEAMDGVNVNVYEEQITLLGCAHPANGAQMYYFRFWIFVVPLSLEPCVIQKYLCVLPKNRWVTRAAYPLCSEQWVMDVSVAVLWNAAKMHPTLFFSATLTSLRRLFSWVFCALNF